MWLLFMKRKKIIFKVVCHTVQTSALVLYKTLHYIYTFLSAFQISTTHYTNREIKVYSSTFQRGG